MMEDDGVTCLDVSCEPLQRAHGSGRVVVGAGRNGRASLTELYQEGSAKIRLPNTHDGHVQAVFLNTAGGLTGGDALCWQAKVGANAHLELTTPACERIYKTTGEPATIATRLQAGEGAILEWLPQETLLFAQSRLERCLEVDLQAGSRFLALEAVGRKRDERYVRFV